MASEVANHVDTENRATISRMTCGRWRSGLPRKWLKQYYRDVHPMAMTRRGGIYHYRHWQFGEVDGNALSVPGDVVTSCPVDRQIEFISDVVYLNADGLASWYATPEDEKVRSQILSDIGLYNGASTTYVTKDDAGRTLIDNIGDAIPQGPPANPTYGVFFRQSKVSQSEFREAVRQIATAWSEVAGVLRLRRWLFEIPDMEAEKRAGYPLRTHPPEDFYHAYIEVSVKAEDVLGSLRLADVASGAIGRVASAIHLQPVTSLTTYVYAGVATDVGLRGYPAVEAIAGLHAEHQRDRRVLEWIYGPVGRG